MSDIQLLLAADNILLKISLITGWQLLQNEVLQEELAKQLSFKLKESYPTCNMNEIEFAFRNNTQVKDWGKSINLALIDEIMIPYLNERAEASAAEQSIVPQITFKTIITTPEEKLADIQEWEEKKDVQVKFIPPYLYEYLIEFGKITPTVKEKWEAMSRSVDLRKSELYEASLNLKIESVLAYKNFLEMYKTGEYKGAEIERIKTLSKKIIVFDYLKVQKESRKQAL